MITLNNKKFAETEKEFTDSLFETGGTCSGYAKVNKRSIKLYDHNHEVVGGINKHLVLHSTFMNQNKPWHTYQTPTIISKDHFKYNSHDDVNNLVIGSDSNGICFK